MVKKTGKKTAKAKKAMRYTCNACGLVVSVDEACGCVDTCDIICCGYEMKPVK